jgi:hypothetical protein
LLCIFEAAEIEAFPNLRHSSPSLERHEPAASPTELWADWVTVLNRRLEQRFNFGSEPRGALYLLLKFLTTGRAQALSAFLRAG